MKKILLFIISVLLLCSCNNEKNNEFNGNGMDYNILCLDVSEIDPFNDNYKYSDKINKQKYINQIEEKYNIKINFKQKTFINEDVFKNINVYYGSNDFLAVYANRTNNGYEVIEHFYPIHDYNNNSGIIKELENNYDNKKLELSSIFNKAYMFYPGKLYSYNFLYYNENLDLGELDPQKLYYSKQWNIEMYKYLLNYNLSSDVNVNMIDNYNMEFKKIFAVNPSMLAAGLLSANGFNFINDNNLNNFSDSKISILEEIEDLFFKYYGYSTSDIDQSMMMFGDDFRWQMEYSPFVCDKTIVTANYQDILNIKECTNMDLLKIVPFPSEDYTKYSSYVDSYNQYGYAIINDDALYNDNFTKEISFKILYELTEGYYIKYPDSQKQLIFEQLSEIMTKESIDLFFTLNENISVEMMGSLYNCFAFEKGCFSTQNFDCKSLNYFLIASPKYNNCLFMYNFTSNSDLIYAAKNFHNKFDYQVVYFSKSGSIEYINILEYYEREYRKFIKS